MPWKEFSCMDVRLRFVVRHLDGEEMARLCREFGISRKTGYKIVERYRDTGLEAFRDRSRRPVRYGNQLPASLETLIVRCKREKPYWGDRKSVVKGKSVSVRVVLGGRRIIKKKKILKIQVHR